MNNSRRSFMLSAATALSAGRIAGANDRIRIGAIGAGQRGAFLVETLAKRSNEVEVLTVCDVWRKRAEQSSAAAGIEAQVVQDHHRVLDRKDIDAVVIATPDHWHTPILLEALAAGKDAFIEKPLTFRMEEGREIVKAVNRHKRVVQVGTQQKSGPHFLEAKQRFIDSGALGKVVLVRGWWVNNSYYRRRAPKGFAYDPQELDWPAFQGRAPKRPFDELRFFGWNCWSDYSTGQTGQLMVHMCDVVHMFMGVSNPLAVTAAGGIFQYPEDRDLPDTISVLVEYGPKFMFSYDCTLSSPRYVEDAEFHGLGGVLQVFRWGYRFTPSERGAPPVEAKGQPCDPPHMTNFLNAVRNRKQPNTDVVYSHYLSSVCHMANLAYRERRRISWDPRWDVEPLSYGV